MATKQPERFGQSFARGSSFEALQWGNRKVSDWPCSEKDEILDQEVDMGEFVDIVICGDPAVISIDDAPNLKELLYGKPPLHMSPRASAMVSEIGMKNEFDEVIEMTQRIFHGPISVDTHDDPEIENMTSIVIDVEGIGSIKEIIEKDAEWHGGIFDAAPQHAEHFCLSVGFPS